MTEHCAPTRESTKPATKSKRGVVKDAITEKAVQWEGLPRTCPLREGVIQGLSSSFAIDYLNHKKRCIVVDGYIGWNPAYRLKVRTFCARSYHALFMHNLLVRPTEKELQEDFTKGVDVHVFNAGEMAVSRSIEGLGNTAVTGLDL
jgi:phosphoenolpyruvate carboxykinase (ATP)